jgi:protein TonB
MATLRQYGIAAIGSLLLHAVAFLALWGWQISAPRPVATPVQGTLMIDLTYFSTSAKGQAAPAERTPAELSKPKVTPTIKPLISKPVPSPVVRRAQGVDATANPKAQTETETLSTSRDGGEADGLAEQAVGSGDEQASYALGSAQNPLPPYPWSARRRGREGRVVIRLSVDALGQPTSAVILMSSGDQSLDQAALGALRHWRLKPAKHLGLPVASEIDVPIRFALK